MQTVWCDRFIFVKHNTVHHSVIHSCTFYTKTCFDTGWNILPLITIHYLQSPPLKKKWITVMWGQSSTRPGKQRQDDSWTKSLSPPLSSRRLLTRNLFVQWATNIETIKKKEIKTYGEKEKCGKEDGKKEASGCSWDEEKVPRCYGNRETRAKRPITATGTESNCRTGVEEMTLRSSEAGCANRTF